MALPVIDCYLDRFTRVLHFLSCHERDVLRRRGANEISPNFFAACWGGTELTVTRRKICEETVSYSYSRTFWRIRAVVWANCECEKHKKGNRVMLLPAADDACSGWCRQTRKLLLQLALSVRGKRQQQGVFMETIKQSTHQYRYLALPDTRCQSFAQSSLVSWNNARHAPNKMPRIDCEPIWWNRLKTTEISMQSTTRSTISRN